MRADVQGKLASLARNLVAIQVRLSGLSPQHNPGLNPVLTSSQGPLGDINLIALPHSDTNVMFGANAIGNNTTWNALAAEALRATSRSAPACSTRRSACAAPTTPPTASA